PSLAAGGMVRQSPVEPAAHHPHFVVEDDRHGQVAVLPGRLLGDEFPMLAVGRTPNVAGSGLERIEPSAEDPQPIPIDRHSACSVSKTQLGASSPASAPEIKPRIADRITIGVLMLQASKVSDSVFPVQAA